MKTAPDPKPAEARYSNAARLLVLKLGGGTVRVADRRPPAPFYADDAPRPAARVAAGATLYVAHCALCHGVVGEAGVFPELRRMSPATYQAFDQIGRGGLLRANGMASFADVLSAADAENIRAYVVDWAQRSRFTAD